MSRIIAARFATFPEAELAAKGLAASSVVKPGEVDIIYVNPPGQHATHPLGGDVGADSGAKGAGARAAGGAVVGGGTGALVGAVVAGPAAAPVGAAAGASVGAYLGALAGALAGLRQHEAPDDEPAEKAARAAGVLVTVCVDRAVRPRVVAALRAFGGKDIETAEGTWENGQWADFDPVTTPVLVDSLTYSEEAS